MDWRGCQDRSIILWDLGEGEDQCLGEGEDQMEQQRYQHGSQESLVLQRLHRGLRPDMGKWRMWRNMIHREKAVSRCSSMELKLLQSVDYKARTNCREVSLLISGPSNLAVWTCTGLPLKSNLQFLTFFCYPKPLAGWCTFMNQPFRYL